MAFEQETTTVRGRHERPEKALPFDDDGFRGHHTTMAAARPLGSPLQERVRQSLELATTIERADSPHDMPEIDRELTMLEGSLQGIYQRVGEVTAAVQLVLNPKSLDSLLEEQRLINDRDEFSPVTPLGRRLREIQYSLTDIEHALSYLGTGIRL